MRTELHSSNDHQKIRNRFNIQESYCAIKANGILGFSNRKDVLRENGDSTGTASSDTNATTLMKNDENKISLEIEVLRWLSGRPASTEGRGYSSQKAGCSLDLVRFVRQGEAILSSIKVTINQQGIPEVQPDSMYPVIRKEILAEQAESGFIDPSHFNETYFPKGMKVYQFTRKVSVTRLPEWAWTRATPFTRSDEQLRKLKAAYIEMAAIINSGDRTRLEASHKEVLRIWPVTTGDSEGEIPLSPYPKGEIEGGEARMQLIRQDNYTIQVMNNGRTVQLYNKPKPTYPPLTYRSIDEDDDKVMGYYALVFSLIDGQFILVT